MKKRVLSGVQATGIMHLGNYLGAIKNWVEMQKNYECFFFIADLHAITVERDPASLKTSTIHAIAAYLAAGIDADITTIFIQSSIKEHTELAWILGCSTPLGWLNRMTQFKDKSGGGNDDANLGLYSYPVLQAADILLYNADIVPVGEDQKQHLELTRDIAGVINRKFGKNLITVPEVIIQNNTRRIMSLKDATRKMSKSDISDLSRINLTDDADTILQKVKKAQTDSEPQIFYHKENRPAVSNLIEIYSALTDYSIEKITELYDGKGFSYLKADLADIIIDKISPISAKINDYLQHQDYILNILKSGKDKAQEVATKQLNIIKNAFGFIELE